MTTWILKMISSSPYEAAYEAAHGTGHVTETLGDLRREAGETGVAAGRVLEAALSLSRPSDGLTREVGGFLAAVKAA